MVPLKLGGIPALESTVSAYGYPIGGERMSVTTGIVSRVDFQLYTHSSVDQHLAIQISAQINPAIAAAGDAGRQSRWRRISRL
jgi:S1-C subfamily serine protease